MITLYGIPNCATVKKARSWLDEHQQAYTFVNFKTDPPDEKLLQQWLDEAGADVLLNRKGTTWRKLSDEEKVAANTLSGAIALMQAHPSVIKRPVLVSQNRVSVGFQAEHYQSLFAFR
ncbi:ArsC family reductase [Neisseria shayeganii]|uniref:ArsC family protein n=1 Tax=Neisseria shayeganii 871 TaxID=1032488 RepID=G4CJX8_9NEIS|nr:ArsC family reductase [Neisseria shayeganii]EGY51869.1 ArsC family protein [Neisseria shayeganii 871]